MAGIVWGRLLVCGKNKDGQLGLSDHDDRSMLTDVRDFDGLQLRQIAAAGNRSHVVTSDGEVYSWGEDRNGSLGLGKWSTDESASLCTPTLVPSMVGYRVASVACGVDHTCALTGEFCPFFLSPSLPSN